MAPTASGMLPEIPKFTLTFCRNGAKGDVSVPTCPRQRSNVRLSVNPGTRSLSTEFVTGSFTHPLRPGCFACWKS